jgi:hypothetical protein
MTEWFMNEDKALRIFARCYNACDFTGVKCRLHKKATFEAYNRFYRSAGREIVSRTLDEKASELRAKPAPNRAYLGFMMVRHDIGGVRAESCVVLTRADPRQAEGIVRIKCTPLHIKDIVAYDPAKCEYTRGDYAGPEG